MQNTVQKSFVDRTDGTNHAMMPKNTKNSIDKKVMPDGRESGNTRPPQAIPRRFIWRRKEEFKMSDKKQDVKQEARKDVDKVESKAESKVEPSKAESRSDPRIESRSSDSSKKDSKHMTIQDLPGVGAATAEKLREAGYDTLMSIAVASPGELTELTGMTEASARKVINAARNGLDMGFESGDDLLKRRALVQKITTGSAEFDKLLGGGVETGAILECFGEFGSGKTQVGHAIAVNVQKLREPGKGDPVAIYLDTENTFRPERLMQLAKGAGLDPVQALKNVKVARAYNSDHQMLLAEKVEELITRQGLNVKALIVDSLTAHFRAEFIGRGTLAERQQKLNKHMHLLLKLADTHNIAVYCTNQVMAKPDVFFGDPTQAIGGHIVAHASTYRVYLRKGKKGSRVAKLIDSPSMPDGEANFIVETDGLKDMK